MGSGTRNAGLWVAAITTIATFGTCSAAHAAADFGPAPNGPFPTGQIPRSVAVGDFNGDGNQDLATANGNSNDVTILLGDGSGNFTAAATSPEAAGPYPSAVAAGDFNGDGNQDLAVTNSGNGTITILLGDGSGNFSAPTSPRPVVVGAYPFSVAVGDFNGDGYQDLATANQSSNDVTILLGDGSGNFDTVTAVPVGAGTNPSSVAIGDFNGDGNQDLATANVSSNDVTILLGDGSGNFTAAATSPEAVGATPYSVAVGDFNGDGSQDLAAANYGSNDVTILLGDGSGNFTPAATSPEGVGASPVSVAIGDFNGDGDQDLATANSNSNDVTILLGDGSGNFTAAATSPEAVGSGPGSVAVADFDGDGEQDLAVANSYSNNVMILLGAGVSPTAVDDSKTLSEDASATTIDVLANDTDSDGGPKTVKSKSNSSHGTVTITNSGADLAYTPDADFCGSDSFTYTLNGGSTATVSITVTCVDDKPVDTTAPDTKLKLVTAVTRGPHHAFRKSHVKFKFRADGPGASFKCTLKGPDGADGPKADFAPCTSPTRYRGLEPGRYKFRVRAIDAAGNADQTPAKYKFKLLG